MMDSWLSTAWVEMRTFPSTTIFSMVSVSPKPRLKEPSTTRSAAATHERRISITRIPRGVGAGPGWEAAGLEFTG